MNVRNAEQALTPEQKKQYGALLFMRIVKDPNSWTHEDIANIAMAPDELREELISEVTNER